MSQVEEKIAMLAEELAAARLVFRKLVRTREADAGDHARINRHRTLAQHVLSELSHTKGPDEADSLLCDVAEGLDWVSRINERVAESKPVAAAPGIRNAERLAERVEDYLAQRRAGRARARRSDAVLAGG